ncbi:PREDICTED: uncharacterized protein LOC108663259 [Theobroma cacao]|uniref:Uncharacterized protein LOC108663259 n=1 Tax=Theobroma cacao TaxID=3641 RepID=A0AB32WX96_THECC|nr:PREDICTED: uncharacterized protein LOC108663259 [Theobroma cacao]
MPWLEVPLLASFIYAKCTKLERLVLWDCLRSLAININTPWIVRGNFNAIIHNGEKLNGAVPYASSMEDFANALLDCGLMDGGYGGNQFTWTNNRMFQQLDRIIYNHHWADFFAYTHIHHLNREGSDHCPLLITCSKNQYRFPSCFRFLHAWVLHHGFKSFMEHNWTSPIVGSGLQAFWVKQRGLKQALKRWNKEVFEEIFHNLKVAERRAVNCEIIFQQEQLMENRAAMNKAYTQLNHLLSVEELFWKQKSGIKWLMEGERNTKIFHMQVKKKQIKSHIFKIENLDGSWIEEPDAVKSSFMCSAINGRAEKSSIQYCKDSVVGPDGFSSYFYQQCWDIVANDLLDAVVDFFHGADLPREITSTTIVLLPKNNNASKWSDFRPISLCNVLNKIITKILANHLAKMLPSMITDNQSGFVGGRLISDNILLAQELMGKIDQKSRGGNIALKLDMMKAYDRLEWDFLYRML